MRTAVLDTSPWLGLRRHRRAGTPGSAPLEAQSESLSQQDRADSRQRDRRHHQTRPAAFCDEATLKLRKAAASGRQGGAGVRLSNPCTDQGLVVARCGDLRQPERKGHHLALAGRKRHLLGGDGEPGGIRLASSRCLRKERREILMESSPHDTRTAPRTHLELLPVRHGGLLQADRRLPMPTA